MKIASRELLAAAFACALIPQLACQAKPEPADLVVTNGKVVTVDDAKPEAQAIAVRGDRIVEVGAHDAIQRYVGTNTQVIDLRGQLAIPGLIESHGHFTGVGESKLVLELSDVRTWDEIVAMVGAAAKTREARPVDLGRGWHQEKWTAPPAPNVEGFPTRCVAQQSVAEQSRDADACQRSRQLRRTPWRWKLSGITRDTKNPAGGEILKDAKGNPTGLLRETAAGLVRRGAGEPARDEDAERRRTRQSRPAARVAKRHCRRA